MTLLESFQEFQTNGRGNGLFLEKLEELQGNFFKTVKAKSPQYFSLNGYAAEDDFSADFYVQFLDKKLYNESVQKFLGKSTSDEALKRNLYSLIQQYYNTAFVSPEVKVAKTVLDAIIGKMTEFELIVTESKNGTRNSMIITRLNHLDFEDIVLKMTAQFRNNPDKYASLYKVIEHLNNNGETRYYDLIEIIKDPPPNQTEPGNGSGGEGTTDGDEGGNSGGVIIDEPVDEDTLEGPANLFGYRPEKSEINNSYLAGITPVAIESLHYVPWDANKLFSELMLEGKNSPKRIRFLISLILNKAGLKKVEAFMFTWLLKGDMSGRIPIDVREQVYKILGIRSAAYYERYDGFQRTLRSIMRLEKHSFEYSEVVSAMLIFYKVYKRICVI